MTRPWATSTTTWGNRAGIRGLPEKIRGSAESENSLVGGGSRRKGDGAPGDYGDLDIADWAIDYEHMCKLEWKRKGCYLSVVDDQTRTRAEGKGGNHQF